MIEIRTFHLIRTSPTDTWKFSDSDRLITQVDMKQGEVVLFQMRD